MSCDELSRGTWETMEEGATRGPFIPLRALIGVLRHPAREHEIIRQEEKEASMKHKMTGGEEGNNCVWRKVDMGFKTAII